MYQFLSAAVTQSVSHAQLFAAPQTVALQSPLSMGSSRQEYWSGSPCPPPGDLPDSGIGFTSPALQADSLLSEPPGKHHILGDLSNRSVWSHISGGEKSRIQVLAELASVVDCGGRVQCGLSSKVWWPQEFSGFDTVVSRSLHIVFPLCVSISVAKFLLCIRILVRLDQGSS